MNFYYFGLCLSSENICDSEDWKTLKIAGFKDRVDAILMPQDASDHEYTTMYAFSGDMYASINPNGGSCVSFSVNCTIASDDDYPVTGYVNYTSKIVDGWGSLKDAGFTNIDAVVNVPYSSRETWFFSGEKYARISWTPGWSLFRHCNLPPVALMSS
jgi:hypothetical protein